MIISGGVVAKKIPMTHICPAPSGAAQSIAESARGAGQIVLVLQGGGALGAYHAGVYQGLAEAGLEPDWIIGTSIGAINGALIAGNKPENRLDRLRQFWDAMGSRHSLGLPGPTSSMLGFFDILCRGVPGFFQPNPLAALMGLHMGLGTMQAGFYGVQPLKDTLSRLIDFESLMTCHPRLTVGAVNVSLGEMRYFDSRDAAISLDHVLASGALPPAFPPVEIDGQWYWDGGIFSNTPAEVVLDDQPRLNSLIFSVNLWQPRGRNPSTLWEVMGRQKEIQYSSRVNSHIEKQDQIHRLRHIIRELGTLLPDEARSDSMIEQMVSYGCGTTMHLVNLLAPRLDGEDHTKDLDFTIEGIRARWSRGHADIQNALEARQWECESNPMQGVIIHEIGGSPP